jgi:hypothetical protein
VRSAEEDSDGRLDDALEGGSGIGDGTVSKIKSLAELIL